MVLKTKLISFQNFFLFFCWETLTQTKCEKIYFEMEESRFTGFFFGRKMFSLNNRRIPVSDFEIKSIFINFEEKRKKLLNLFSK